MKRVITICALIALASAVATAQPQGRRGQGFQRPGGGGRGGGSRPGTAGSATLERAGLEIGQPLPDLTVFDESGAKFQLADVKGKHTVIVFGCMT